MPRSASPSLAGVVGRFLTAVIGGIVLLGHSATAKSGKTMPDTIYPVGIREIEYIDAHGGNRHLSLWMFYPAAPVAQTTKQFVVPFSVNLHLYKDAPVAPGGGKHPLIMFSHGRGGNGLQYAWFAQFLAAHGYMVAAVNHYRANSWDATIAYQANKLWQKPLDISLDISFLLHDPVWGQYIDAARIGVAGHSQGGFTALWIGGAKINPERFLAFQRGWRNNQTVPKYLRDELPVDAGPAMHVHDPRVKAVLAMAPGIVQAFGMDAAGLRQLSVPTYIVVGAQDTMTPPEQNAEFAARYVPHATLQIIPGPVVTRSSSTNATPKGRTSSRKPASTHPAWIVRRSTCRSRMRRCGSSTPAWVSSGATRPGARHYPAFNPQARAS